MKFASAFATAVIAAVTAPAVTAAPASLLNASYDVSREFYAAYNPLFARHWKATKGEDVKIEQAHTGSSKQARAVIDGLEADVVTMNQETDIDAMAKAGLIEAGWRKRFPDNSAPYASTIVFLVRKGNPKGIKDWGDVAKDGVSVIVPNPKTSGNGRYSYLAAWAYALRQPGADEAKARDFVAAIFHKNTGEAGLPPGGRDATNTFVQHRIGDVLLTFENETLQISRVFSPDQFEVVTPSLSIRADAPVSVVDKVADRRGTRALATEYLAHLWSPEAQELIARHFLRPKSQEVLAAHASDFRPIELVGVDDAFGGWAAAQAKHFNDGGTFDQISQGSRP